jgi:DNA repair protein RecN (Recombination protein N)
VLRELHVRNLALIEDVWLEFAPGMTVLTGETGAGKTALVGALKLLVGERADSTLVRAGAEEALVEGILEVDGVDISARRRVGADGRSRCLLDDEMATVGRLAQTFGRLVDLHGQHEHQALLQASRHVEYLDRFGGTSIEDVLGRYRRARDEYRAAVEDLKLRTDSREDAERRVDYLRFLLADIDSVTPLENEDEEIMARLAVLKHSDRIAQAVADALVAVRGEDGAADRVAVAQASVMRIIEIDANLESIAERLTESLALLEDLSADLRAYGERIEHDPTALDALESRLAALTGLKKKYGPDLAGVLLRHRDATAELDALGENQEGIARAQARLEKARTEYSDLASKLTDARQAVVGAFLSGLHEAVNDLSMDGARFEVSNTELPFDQWTDDGPHHIEFTYAPGPDQPYRPLAKIASGGEISRVMLALKGVLGRADDVPVLVFDEVDAGIGGLTASAVGRRLKSLAERHQVLVVTHLAQVAVFADAHLVVTKTIERERVSTAVDVVEGESRVGEIARMLSGADTEASRAHARELLLEAGHRL